ncbi:hypothetical protein [Seohaeicola zhoushanensis]|uniref:Uncharacterized protein n=1 Tax=Seohaeicola zhoushanensis TaxID=1569283 RepID=A0A8J3GTV9_9RHOB|nr:hypothetical protein [Seohaeicola zhoushanensis]GHF33112.1 hypothetical protein GCM10017056_00640 [Seohaeicola zhoushanensis]
MWQTFVDIFTWVGGAGLVFLAGSTAWSIVRGGGRKPDPAPETQDDFHGAMARWRDMQSRTEQGR